MKKNVVIICVTLALAMIAGTGLAFAQEKPSLAKDSSTEINVRNADLAAVVRIFSKKTKRNYILDEKVTGKVSIYLPGKISSAESIRILDSVLALKGFTSVPIGDNLWKIVPAKDAKQSTIPTIIDETGRKPTAAMVTRLVNLKYVTADDIKQLLSPLISGNGLLNAYTGTNSLIIIDSEDNIARIIRIVDELDVPFSDREMTIIPITHADAPDIADKLNEILLEKSGGSSPSSQSAGDIVRARLRDQKSGGKSPAAVANAAATTIAARLREPKIIADERTNSIIVVADDDTTARIRALTSQLDSEVNLSGQRFYVYRCQHASAEEIAEVLSNLASGDNTTARPNPTQQSSAQRSQQRSANRLAQQRRTPGQSRTTPGTGGTTTPVAFGENVSITADPATNSLIIASARSDYEKIIELLEELDVKRRQVLVEAMLLEVGITENAEMGIEWLTSGGGSDGGVIAQSSFDNLGTLLSDPASLSGFTLAAASAGTLTLPGNITIPSQTIMMSAAAANQNVNVLSAPNILATDNEQAEIVVGQNVPFLASTSTSEQNLSNTFNQIDRQDVGITLRLTPQISSNDFVSLNIFTEVSDIIPASLGSELGASTTVRTSETTAIAKDGQMVVIGGLISDDITENDRGVPFFKDIPVLGHFFKVQGNTFERTNLLIFITPHIVRDQFDARDLTVDSRGPFKSDMDHFGVEPKRRAILDNPDMNNVMERPEFSTESPGTIRPPKRTVPDSAVPFSEMDRPAGSSSGSTSAPIELRVKPKLPGQASNKAPALSSKARASVKLGTTQPTSQAGRYVVFDITRGTLPSNIPFSKGGNVRRFGVVVPANSGMQAKSFFAIGQRYQYKLEGNDINVKPVGVFQSENDAAALYPDVSSGSWHTLSPYEIMNLGRSPWIRVTN